MADRPNQYNGYPTISNNFGGGMNQFQQQMQMQSLASQQQQNALNQNRGIPGGSNTENQQMWQQLQNQHRSQMGGMDMGNQGMAQMAGMNRNNPFMNQMQGQGQSMQQYSNLINNVRQQQQQLAQRPLLQQQQQGFGPNVNQQLNHMPQLNNPAMLQALNPGLSRQFVRLGQAHQQRPQNGPLDPAAFPQQNAQMNGHHIGMDNAFASADGPSIQRMAPTMNSAASQSFLDQVTNFMMDKEGRRLTFEDLNIKMSLFMRETENEQHKLDTMQLNPAETQQLANRVNARNMFLQQVRQRVANEFPMNSQANTPMHMPNMQAQGQQQSPAQRVQTPQQGWNTPVMSGAPAQQNGAMFAHGQTVPSNPQMQFSAALAAQQAGANAMQRNVPTPVTQLGGPSLLNRPMNSSPRPVNGQLGPGGPGHGVGVMQQIMSGRNIHPIEKDKFNESLPQYLHRTGKTLNDQTLMMPSGQKLDLHALHTLVINQGGGPAVKSNDLWPIIAARLGFPIAPGSNPERAQQPYADRAREIYDEYLQDFEKHYTMMVLDKLVRTNTLPTGFGNAPQNQPQGPPQSGLPPGLPQPLTPNQINPKLVLTQLVRGNLTVEMMRTKGLPENLIQQVEMLRRQAALNAQGMQGTVLQGSRPPGGQAQLSGPPENFPGNNQMAGTPNGPPLRQMPGMQLQQGQMMPGQPTLTAQGQMQHQILTKTTPERLQAAGLLVKKMREQANEDRNKKPTQQKYIPDNEKQTFAQIFEALLKMASEVNNFLPTFHAVVGDENTTRTMVQVYDMAMRQRQLLSSPSPEYMLDLNMVKRLLQMVVAFRNQLQVVFQQGDRSRLNVGANGGNNGTGGFPPPPPPSVMSAQQPVPQPVPQVPAHVGPTNPGMPALQPNRPPMQPTSIASKGKPQNSIPVASGSQSTQIAASPAASALTPSQSASAASPTSHASPQTPKSPKARNTTKKAAAKQTARRPSKANLPSTPTTEQQPSTPASSAPTPATIASTPDNKDTSLKRQREPDSSFGVASNDQPSSSSNDDGPLAKRLKGEWENTPDHTIPKHEEEAAAAIKTTEQTAEYFSQMTAELIQMVGGSDGQTMPSEVSDVITQVLKSAGSFPSLGDSSIGDEPLASGSKSPKLASQDEFTEYFDYSYFKDEETPDLTANSSTSTGASPESNSAENGSHVPPPPDSSKSNDSKLAAALSSDAFDPSQLGFLGEIDGGEAEYFTSKDGWRWDEIPSATQDTHWAIST